MTSQNSLKVKAVMFDFFGTLVEYQPDRSRLGYPATYDLAVSHGYAGNHAAFVQTWDEASAALEVDSKQTLREFSMTQAAQAFADADGLEITADQAATLGGSFVNEWAQHITPAPGVEAMVKQFAGSVMVSVVSNTHDPKMVPNMLEEMSLGEDIAAVTLSVDHGWAKPHPSIYAAALAVLQLPASEVVFVGDNFEADYVGPTESGIRSYMIDADCNHPVPAENRLATVLDIARVFPWLNR